MTQETVAEPQTTPETGELPAAVTDAVPAVALPDAVKVKKTFSLPGIAFCIASRADSTLIYTGLSDFSVRKADVSAEKIDPTAINAEGHSSYVTGLVRAGETLVSGGYDCSLIWWNAETGEIIRRVPDAHGKWIRQLAVSPDGARVASVADDMKTKLWDSATGECLATWGDYESKTPQGYPSMLYAVTFSPDGKWLATGDRTGRVLVRDAASGQIAATLETPVMYTWDPKARRHSIGGIRSLAFSRDSSQLAVGGMGKVGNIDHLEGASRIEVFRWQTNERRFEIEDSKHKGLVESLQFGPGDAFLVAAGGDNSGFVSVYNMSDGKLLTQDKAPMHVHDFELQPDGRSLIAVGHNQGTLMDLFKV
jgi:WD40 repeat protein